MPRLPFLVLLTLLVGCDRPFVEPTAPTLEVLEPTDLGTVRTEQRLPLAFRASSSFRAVDRVEVNGEPATYRSQEDAYLDTLRLEVGLNTIHVAAFDAEGTVGEDTLFAMYLPYQFASIADHLPAPRGGHAATTLADGTVLITGGAASSTAAAQDGALRFARSTFAFTEEPEPLRAARVGHTASLLPDGRVLLLGGSTRVTPVAIADLVTMAEVFDPADGSFTEVPVVDEAGTPALPIQRTGHTATVLEGEGGTPFVYLYGGLGPRYDSETLAPTEFMRTLRFETDRLVAVGPRERFRFVPIFGHTQTPLTDVGTDGFGHYLVAGASLPGGDGPAAPFVFTFGPNLVDTAATADAAQARTDHAAARFGGLVLVTGGRGPDTLEALRDGEVFAHEARRFFRFGDDPRPNVPRWGHTATNLGDGRILLVGGFSASGDALDRSELFLPR